MISFDVNEPHPTVHNVPHSQWLAFVDRITRQWGHFVADYNARELPEVNAVRAEVGLPALTIDDV